MLDKLPPWIAVACGIAAGALLIVGAIVTKTVVLVPWGITVLAGSIIAGVSGAKGRPDGALKPKTIGAKLKEIPSGAWAIIALMMAGSVVLTVAASRIT